MGKLRSFRYALLAAGFTLALLIHAQDQDQSGFISIDCGIPAGSSYTDKTTGIVYISDSNLTDTGIIRSIAPEFQTTDLEQQFYNVRSFPEGVKNCYNLYSEQSKDDKYLIRARFMYGNYDGLEHVPQFDLYLGVSIWDTIKLDNASSMVTTEIIIPSTNYIYVCLVNKGSGKPFISSLELRLLKNLTYQTQRLSESLVLHRRLDLGSLTNQLVRYNADIYDRIWMPKSIPGWKILSISALQPIDIQKSNKFQPAPAVLRTAVVPENDAQALSFYVGESTDSTSQYYVYMHFAEVERLDGSQTREFNIFLNGNLFYRSVVPSYCNSETIFSPKPIQGGRIYFTISATNNSNLPPILNAIEIYMVKDYSQWQTHQADVDAIVDIKSIYGVKRNWQGDPCAPQAYRWDGLNCSYEDNSSPRIICLNLSSSGLTGEIAPRIADMTSLQFLDLSNNSLSGSVPVVLSRMPYLRLLNLKGNKLTGSLPAELMKRSTNGSLTLSVEENSGICLLASCEKKKNKSLVPVVVSVATFSTVLIALVIFIKMRKNHADGKGDSGLEYANDSIVSKNHQFTYSDVVRITNNFSRVLGKGGFGTVYYGSLDDTQQLAVKMLSSSSPQGYKEFRSEVKLLTRVHHRNLVTLVGYCLEGTNMGLIYEYMANGSLDRYLSGGNEYLLSWEDRMRIAVDAAKGLEYLHSGCKSPIVHRDVKPSNILLNEKHQAKIGDFGISRICPKESATSIWTDVAGTPGYLDPESSLSNQLNEKSDVYSFGIVLLKIITNQPVIAKISLQNVHITEWIKSKLAEQDIRKIVDPRLGDNFNINSAWKAVDIALTCASENSSERPTMTEVVLELKECSAVDIAQNDEGHDKSVNFNSETEFTPLAR